MIPQIRTAQIVAVDLPDYYDECVKEGVTPLVGRASGWQEVTAASDTAKKVFATVKDEYGEKDIEVEPNAVVNVATYEKVEVVR